MTAIQVTVSYCASTGLCLAGYRDVAVAVANKTAVSAAVGTDGVVLAGGLGVVAFQPPRLDV